MPLRFSNPAFRLIPPGYDRVELTEPLVIRHSFGDVVIPAGFKCDFESVPKLIQLLPSMEKIGRGAVPGTIHDYLYATGLVSKPEADALYLEAMKQCRVPLLARWTKYLAVRLCGGPAWRGHRRK